MGNGPDKENGDGLGTADLADDGDRISVTDAHGTVARFEMAYSPTESDRFQFGPPLRQRIVGFLFLGFAMAMVGLVVYGESSGSPPGLSAWLADRDRGQPIGSLGLSIFVLVCALGTVAAAQMRGLIVRGDGIETRSSSAGFPRISRRTWAQIERIIVDDKSIMVELWNGEYERLPAVADHRGASDLLERIASGRKIRVTRLPSA
jgi:hypothetical protein